MAGGVDFVWGYSAMLGCLASVLPTAWAARRVFSAPASEADGGESDSPGATGGAYAAHEVQAGRLYGAEVGKLAGMAALLSATLIAVEPLHVEVMISVFALTYLVYVVGTMLGNVRSRPQL